MDTGPDFVRTVVPLLDSGYTVVSLKNGVAVLAKGKEVEVWARALRPQKSYAIEIEGQEYEFQRAEVPPPVRREA